MRKKAFLITGELAPAGLCIAERGTGLPSLSLYSFPSLWLPASASLRIVSRDEVEQTLLRQSASVPTLPMVFAYHLLPEYVFAFAETLNSQSTRAGEALYHGIASRINRIQSKQRCLD